ncbi:MAG: hypothetical protein AB7P00_33225 [Sandaracinaceae bacterium]
MKRVVLLVASLLVACKGNDEVCTSHGECDSHRCCYDAERSVRQCVEAACDFCIGDTDCSNNPDGRTFCCLGRCTSAACEGPDGGRRDAGSTPNDAATTDGATGDAATGDGAIDGGPIVIAPPTDPVATVEGPERPNRSIGPASAITTISADVATIAIPGGGEVAIHDLVTGTIVHRYPTLATPYATEHLFAGGFDRLVTVAAEGANANACTPTGVSMFGQVLFLASANVTDVSPVGAAPTNLAILTDNTNGAIMRLLFNETSSLFELDRVTSIPLSTGGGRAVSAEAPMGDSPVLVAVDGSPGELLWVDWAAGPASFTTVGALGDGPRILDCSPDGRVCFVPNFGSATVTVVDTVTSPPSIRETVSVGAGPISVHVASLDGTNVGVTTGFSDGSISYLVDEGTSVRVATAALSDCASPGHALLIEELRWVVVTCNADDTYVVRSIPSDVP